MKSCFFIALLSAGLVLRIPAQVAMLSSPHFHLPVLDQKPPGHLFFTMAATRQPVKEIFTLRYQPPKLPFFCSMEEKTRTKFNFFLKLRAGDDESYMKMIKGSGK